MAKSSRRAKGSGSVFKKPGGVYCYQYRDLTGKLKTVSLKNEDGSPVKDRKEAVKLAIKETAEYHKIVNADTREKHAAQVAEYRGIVKNNQLAVDKVWGLYHANPSRPDSSAGTLSNYKRIWTKFEEWLRRRHPNIKTLGQISEETCREYSGFILEEKISANTFNYKIGALRLIFRILSQNETLGVNPWKCIARKAERKFSRREFDKSQILQLLESFNDEKLQLLHKAEMRTMFHLGVWTGLRLADCAMIKWENIDMENRRIHCVPQKTAHKTQKLVTIPMHPDLREVLLSTAENRQNEYVLPGTASRYLYNPSGVRKDAIKVFKFCEFETTSAEELDDRKLKPNQYGFHSFRHSFVSFCAKAGVPLPIVQSIVGHGNPAITRHYVHLGEESLKQAIRALPSNSETTQEISSPLEKCHKIRHLLKGKTDLTPTEDRILKILAE